LLLGQPDVYSCAFGAFKNEVAGILRVRTKWGKKRIKRIIPPKIETNQGNAELTGLFSNRELSAIFQSKHFDEVRLCDGKLIDLGAAECIATAASVRRLSVWSRVTRPAFSRLMNVSGLKEALVSEFAGSGRLRNLDRASDVETLRSLRGLNSIDILEVAKLPKLKSLIAQCSEFGLNATDAIRSMQTLQVIDFEGVLFSDEMAKSLSKSKSLTHLGLPATGLSTISLKHISEMPQLTYLDIWANGFVADDLDVLAGHSNLQILELGGFGDDDDERKRASAYIPKLEKMPALTTVYFEGVHTTQEEAAYLKNRYIFKNL
jgi:hypothetical protein